jgi:hypothetical protein
MSMTTTIQTPDGDDVRVSRMGRTEKGYRLKIDVDEGPCWEVNVHRNGGRSVQMSWDADGNMADIDEPSWLDDIILQAR